MEPSSALSRRPAGTQPAAPRLVRGTRRGSQRPGWRPGEGGRVLEAAVESGLLISRGIWHRLPYFWALPSVKRAADGERYGQPRIPSGREAASGTAHPAFTAHSFPQRGGLFRLVAYFLALLTFISFTGFHKASLRFSSHLTDEKTETHQVP